MCGTIFVVLPQSSFVSWPKRENGAQAAQGFVVPSPMSAAEPATWQVTKARRQTKNFVWTPVKLPFGNCAGPRSRIAFVEIGFQSSLPETAVSSAPSIMSYLTFFVPAGGRCEEVCSGNRRTLLRGRTPSIRCESSSQVPEGAVLHLDCQLQG